MLKLVTIKNYKIFHILAIFSRDIFSRKIILILIFKAIAKKNGAFIMKKLDYKIYHTFVNGNLVYNNGMIKNIKNGKILSFNH